MSSLKIKTVDVCLSPDLIHLYELASRSIVVVDILRATSCMTTAFAHGIQSIQVFSDLNACSQMKVKGFYTAGERNGEKVNGFDMGNSPFEYMSEIIKGKSIAITTTNGTQAIEKSKGAKEIIIGSFLNLSAVAEHLNDSDNDVLIVCAGWKGKVNLEDTLFAGALIEKLGDRVKPDCDAPLMALHLYQAARNDLVGFLKNSSHVQRLNRLNIHKDIEFCLTLDQYDVVPILKNGALTCHK